MHIPLSEPFVNKEIRIAAIKALKSKRYILGKYTEKFEKRFSEFIGTKFAICVSSGTAAIFLSLLAIGAKEGDEILVPSFTAFPTVEPILMLKCIPVFVDVSSNYTVDIDDMKAKLTKKTVGIIPVHIYGHPAKMDEVSEFARKNSLFVIEDCCQAHGAEFEGKKVGSLGNIACFSFYPSKNLTVCGEGGMITTNDEEVYYKVLKLRDHGRSDRYTHEMLGFNFRFNEIQAAIGIQQLNKLEFFNSKRRDIARFYINNITTNFIDLPIEESWAKHVYHLFVVRCKKDRDKLKNYLRYKRINSEIHYPIPAHLQPVIKNYNYKAENLRNTEKFCSEILSIPIFPKLNRRKQEYICSSINEYFGN